MTYGPVTPSEARRAVDDLLKMMDMTKGGMENLSKPDRDFVFDLVSTYDAVARAGGC